MTDAELAAALGTGVAERRPWPYASSSPLEELLLEGAEPRRVLFKDLTESTSLARPTFLPDPQRELAVYRDVLGPTGIDAPACHLAVVEAGRAWLFLEVIDGEPLWQIGELEIWEEAARWLARMHALPTPRSPRLLRYDAAHLQARFGRSGAIPRSREIAARVAERLARLPATFVHGDFYPSNVLVAAAPGTRIRPVDWETAGIGPGVLDLAALTAGSWSAEERSRIERAYLEACPDDGRPDADDLDCARLLVAAQWLAAPGEWEPPPQHAHDWRSEAEHLIRRLGL